MAVSELTCKELVEIVTDYLEDALPPAERARFEAHLARCGGCTTYLEQFRQMLRALGKLTEDSISDEARDKLLNVFRDWKQSTGK